MKPVKTSYKELEALDFPGAITLRVLLSGSQTNGNQAIFEDIVQPGIGPGRHIHHGQDEPFLFLEGQFDVEIDGELYQMEPGDIGFVPRETVHALKNVGKSPGRLSYVFSPALRIEDMFRAFYDAQSNGELTPEQMVQVAEVHGQSFVGPPL